MARFSSHAYLKYPLLSENPFALSYSPAGRGAHSLYVPAIFQPMRDVLLPSAGGVLLPPARPLGDVKAFRAAPFFRTF